MVSTFNASDVDVSYEFDEFIYLNTDDTTEDILGYNWKLELPIDPDPIVDIVDGNQTFRFEYIEQLSDEEFYRAVERTEK